MVTGISEEIKKDFRNLVISRGDTHDLLSMTIKIRNGNKMELIMKHQIENTVSQLKDICDFNVTFTCAQHLWDISDEAELLDDVKADLFHLLTPKLIYITKMTRPDIEPDVSFFTTRVAKSNVDYWKKLRICISYLNQTVDNVRVIGVFNIT